MSNRLRRALEERRDLIGQSTLVALAANRLDNAMWDQKRGNCSPERIGSNAGTYLQRALEASEHMDADDIRLCAEITGLTFNNVRRQRQALTGTP